MKRFFIVCLAISIFSPLSVFAGGLEDFLASVNIQARADLPGFSAKISAQFGVPATKVQTVIQSVHEPADAFMIFQLGQMAGKQPDSVMNIYEPNRKKGWGVIAKQLGIKPGSADFHALKSGNLHFTGQPGGSDSSPGKSKGKGHGKGNNK